MQNDEDYWNTSSVSRNKTRGNVFDESYDWEGVKNTLNQQQYSANDESDIEQINWDGTPKKQESQIRLQQGAVSARYRPPGKSDGKTAPKAALNGMSVSGKTSTAHLSNKEVEPSINDIVNSNRPNQPTHSEVAKLETNVNFLKRQLDAAKKDRFTKAPVKDTVRRIISGQPYTFELYKSREDKISLLNESIKVHDGNAIIAAVLFLRDSVKSSIFNLEMSKRPVAANHYISYLTHRGEMQALKDFLSMLGRVEDAAMLHYKQAVAVRNTESRKQALVRCCTSHFKTQSFLSHQASLIDEQVSLIERQLPIEAQDSRDAKAGMQVFKEFPRPCALIDQPLLTTLYYCCFYHYPDSETTLGSPIAIKKAHKLTDKQYIWIALSARAKRKQWNDVEALFHSKGWFGGNKKKSVIGFEKVVLALSQVEAPKDILNKYCKLIDDSEKRLKTATKYKCHEIALETLMQLKDRQALIQYQSKTKLNSPEWFYASDILKNSSIKWKN